MTEREKYLTIYGNPDKWAGYGSSNHGKDLSPWLISQKPRTILDVGCGDNSFAKQIRAETDIYVHGVDFAHPGADSICDVMDLALDLRDFDFITAFDVLEHLLPEQVEPALKGMAMVSKRFAFSISYTDSRNRVNGETLHPTVQSKLWWINTIEQFGEVREQGKYLVGEWDL